MIMILWLWMLLYVENRAWDVRGGFPKTEWMDSAENITKDYHVGGHWP